MWDRRLGRNILEGLVQTNSEGDPSSIYRVCLMVSLVLSSGSSCHHLERLRHREVRSLAQVTQPVIDRDSVCTS